MGIAKLKLESADLAGAQAIKEWLEATAKEADSSPSLQWIASYLVTDIDDAIRGWRASQGAQPSEQARQGI